MTFWPLEREQRLETLWKQGFTATEIVADLGDLTRNAVIGKAHRMGLSKTVKTPSAELIALRRERHRWHGRAQPERPYKTRTGPPRGSYRADLRKIAPIVDTDIPLEQRKQLIELNGHNCHWPVGDPDKPDFFFCGAPAEAKQSYCSAHCARAYVYTG